MTVKSDQSRETLFGATTQLRFAAAFFARQQNDIAPAAPWPQSFRFGGQARKPTARFTA
jgi:hypothetical protein